MDEITEKRIEAAVQRAFSAGVGEKRFIDISRIPLICQSIISIESRLKGIEGNLSWGVKIILGAFILGLVALVWK